MAWVSRSAGFTLFELLVVLAILAVVAVIAIPSFSSGSGAELRAAARTLAAGLRQTRSRAVTQNRPLTLTLNVESRQFRVGGNTRPRRLPADVELKLNTARSELLGENTGAIRFFPDGSSTGGRITVGSAHGASYLIDVNWLTGRVSILDGVSGDALNGQ